MKKLDTTKIIETLRAWNISQNKGLIFVCLIAAAAVIYAFATPSGKKPPRRASGAGQQQQSIKLDNKEMVDLALQKEQAQAPPLQIPQPKERIVIDNSNKTERPPAPRQRSTVNVEGRRPTSLEQVRAVWDVDYVPVRGMRYAGAIVPKKPEPVAAVAPPAAAESNVEPVKDNAIGHILPGTEIYAVLTTGMLATELTDVPFVAKVTMAKGPKGYKLHEYNGCLLYGTAKLNRNTQRAEAKTRYLSCVDRMSTLTGDGIGEDRTYGFDGRYYERLADRLAYEFVGTGLGEYFEARAKGLTTEDAYVAGEAVAVTKNYVSPSEYAMWKGLSGAAKSTEDELRDIGSRKVPVIAIDPGRRLSFVVSQPTIVRALYDVE